jgi:uncharacterized membrane protein HdeD (DUF308 family)
MAPVQASKASGHRVAAEAHPSHAVFIQQWWAVSIRGGLGILLGVTALLPGVTMRSLVLVFAAYAALDGAFAIAAAFRAARGHRHWGLLVLEGAAGVVAGVFIWFLPGISLTAFVLLVGAWAFVSGLLMYGGAFALHIHYGRYWLVLGGVASLVFGAILVSSPFVGAVVPAWAIGAYALIFGAALLVLGLVLRARTTDRRASADPRQASAAAGPTRPARKPKRAAP